MDLRLSGELQRALEKIPERQRAALLLAELHDLTGLELAAALGVSHVAARALLTRARESLRQALAVERQAVADAEAAADAARRRGGPAVSPPAPPRRRPTTTAPASSPRSAIDEPLERAGRRLARRPPRRLRGVRRRRRRPTRPTASCSAPLREAPPMPPRDLWARTAAAIDAESGGSRPVARRGRRRPRPPGRLARAARRPRRRGDRRGLRRCSTAPPSCPQPGGPSGPPPTPIAIAAGDVAVLSRGADGSYELQTGSVDEVCPLVGGLAARREPSFEATQVAAHRRRGQRRARSSRRRATGSSWSSGARPVPTASSSSRSGRPREREPGHGAVGAHRCRERVDARRDRRPRLATATTASARRRRRTSTPGPDGHAGRRAGDVPRTSRRPPRRPRRPTPVPDDPGPRPTPPRADREPTADARRPRRRPSRPRSPTVAVTPGPGDALQIASDVIVVGGVAAYNADGSGSPSRPARRTARRARTSTCGTPSDTQARARHHGPRVDLRRLGRRGPAREPGRRRDAADARRRCPRPARPRAEQGHDAWLPTVAPGRHARRVVGRHGRPRRRRRHVGPGRGPAACIGAWPGDAGDEQVLAEGRLRGLGGPLGRRRARPWAVWTGGEGRPRPGRLSLYAVDPETGRASARLADPRRRAGVRGLLARERAHRLPGTRRGRRSAPCGWSPGRATPSAAWSCPGEAGATVVR